MIRSRPSSRRWSISVMSLWVFFNDAATTEIYTLSLHDALPIYFTGTTNMLGVASGSLAAFPLFNAQQSCLNEASTVNCASQSNTPTTDAIAVKINPNQPGSFPLYSTYLGGSDSDYGNGISVDTSGNAYIVGTTSSRS